MTFERVISFFKKKCFFLLTAASVCVRCCHKTPLNVLLKKINCCTRFMYLFYIDIFMYLFTLQSYEAEIPLKYKTSASVSFLSL